MKIALLASTFLPRIGGAEIVVHNLARQLRAAGHDARVITWWGQWRGVRGKVDYPVIPLAPRSFTVKDRARWEAGEGSSRFVGAQIEILQKIFKFDVWNIHMAYPLGMLAVPTLKRMGVPVVTTCHGDDIFVDERLGFRLLMNEHCRAGVVSALKESQLVTAISPSVRERYMDLGLDPARIADISNGVACQRIEQVEADRGALRAEYGWPQDIPVILSVGRHHKQKGYDLIPAIARVLNEQGKRFLWVMIGSGVPEFIASLGADSGRLSSLRGYGPFAGSVGFDEFPPKALVSVMKACDVFVLPSRFETFGLVLVEAMAAGLPVCTTDALGCRDVVQPRVNGLISGVDDVEGMAANIAELLDHPALRERLGMAGLDYARNLDWSRISPHYVEAYTKAIRMLHHMNSMEATRHVD